MGVHVGVVVRRGEFWHPALSRVAVDGYGYALHDTLHLFAQPLIAQGVRSLEDFLWHDPSDLQQWIARLTSQGLDTARPQQLLAQLQTQIDWHSPTEGLMSVGMALGILQAAMDHRADANILPMLQPELDALKSDLEAIAHALRLAQADNAQFRLQIFDS